MILFGDRRLGNGELTNGWYIDSGNMIPGAGWLSAGPGYRQWYANDRAVVEQARIEFPRLLRSRFLVGSQIRWQDFPQVASFGEGPATSKSNRSEYGFQSSNIVGYATFSRC